MLSGHDLFHLIKYHCKLLSVSSTTVAIMKQSHAIHLFSTGCHLPVSYIILMISIQQFQYGENSYYNSVEANLYNVGL